MQTKKEESAKNRSEIAKEEKKAIDNEIRLLININVRQEVKKGNLV